MRVVGGIAKGRRLAPPAIPGARPTSELVRTAIFNILSSGALEGARIVDLYAGTGALGIEGLSRGASWADFVEQDPRQCAVARSNLEVTGFGDKAQVFCMKVELAIGVLKGPYRVVLMDPPYRLETLDPIIMALHQRGLVETEAMMVVGHSKRTPIASEYGGLLRVDSRRYGDSVVDFFAMEGSP